MALYRKITLGLVAAIVFGVLIFAYICANNYSLNANKKIDLCLYKDSKNLKNDILRKTPIGASADEVLSFIKTSLVYKDTSTGTKLESKGLERYDSKSSAEYTVGAYSITLLVGSYHAPKTYFLFKKNVFISWAFDKDRRLVEVFVDKLMSK